MKRLLWALAVLLLFLYAPASAASLIAKIDISEQKMRIFVNGVPRHTWAVSTARRGYVTPLGNYRPQRLEKMWHSRKYNMSPMPHSIFYHRGYAIHGTDAVKNLGNPASHGCVRLHPANAERLFALVSRYGMGNMRIEVVR